MTLPLDERSRDACKYGVIECTQVGRELRGGHRHHDQEALQRNDEDFGRHWNSVASLRHCQSEGNGPLVNVR
jgi:hypothetical protein